MIIKQGADKKDYFTFNKTSFNEKDYPKDSKLIKDLAGAVATGLACKDDVATLLAELDDLTCPLCQKKGHFRTCSTYKTLREQEGNPVQKLDQIIQEEIVIPKRLAVKEKKADEAKRRQSIIASRRKRKGKQTFSDILECFIATQYMKRK